MISTKNRKSYILVTTSQLQNTIKMKKLGNFHGFFPGGYLRQELYRKNPLVCQPKDDRKIWPGCLISGI